MITKYSQKSLYEYSIRFMFTLKIGIKMFTYVLDNHRYQYTENH